MNALEAVRFIIGWPEPKEEDTSAMLADIRAEVEEQEYENAAYEREEAERWASLQAQYSHACRRCGGIGWLDGGFENVGERGMMILMRADSEPCPDCLSQLHCPLCGHRLDATDDGYGICTACGYDSDLAYETGWGFAQ